jgi:tRNA threonylcarbamoyl adenosine modification protein (Sua5/YciO/YrdC/YwlC family)
MAEYIKLYEENPDPRRVRQLVEVLKNGGVIIYPTDTVYSFGCDITQQKAVEKICRIKGINPKKHNFSIVCADLGHLAQYTRVIHKPVFKLMKKALPGPYTFILEASAQVPKVLHSNKKTVGIRVPNHGVPRAIVEELGHPILSSSLREEEGFLDYSTDPELIFEKYQHLVDIVIDGGYGGSEPSTVLDCTSEEVICLREGLGKLEELL